MARQLPEELAAVIIGGGPSSLILSYILHGNIPFYTGRHHDDLLHTKLSSGSSLLSISPDVYAHLHNSLRYSNQALPINTLLDTLIRPNADVELNPLSCVEWRHCPELAVKHIILTSAPRAGGQWTFEETGSAALSYAEQLGLPSFSFADWYRQDRNDEVPDFYRPTRAEVATYYAAYPRAVGIEDAFVYNSTATGVERIPAGFRIEPHNIVARNLVLASGIFNFATPAPPLLTPLSKLNNEALPLLVIGSGFSAADAIISENPRRKILHLFRWDPYEKPSPLKACHSQAYPDYAGVYRLMKLAALSRTPQSPSLKRRGSYFGQRNWNDVYEGLPNVTIESCQVSGNSARLSLRMRDGSLQERLVGGLKYVIGRRGSLDFLSRALRHEITGDDEAESVTSRTLRRTAEQTTEVAKNVFITGSLTGDSLVRHAYGACVFAAGRILGIDPKSDHRAITAAVEAKSFEARKELGTCERESAMGHADLHVDRRELAVGYPS